MDYRLATIKASETYSADKTELIDIDLSDPISELLILFDLNCGGAGSMTAAPAASLSSIKIVDGSDVLFSMNCHRVQALDWYMRYTLRSPWNAAMSGSSGNFVAAITFGRYLWDELLAFDPKKFKNPQLQITMDVDASLNTQTTIALKVMAQCFDEKAISPVGFLTARDLKTYAMSSSGHEYTDLPIDRKIRGLIVQSLTAGTEPNQLIENFKLSEDQDKKVIFDHPDSDIFRAFSYYNEPLRETWWFVLGTSNRYIFCTPTTRVGGTIQPWKTTQGGSNDSSFYDGDGGRAKTIGESGFNAQVMIEGWLPHGCYYLPLHGQDTPEGYYDPSKLNNLKLDIEAGSGASSSNNTTIAIHQLRQY